MWMGIGYYVKAYFGAYVLFIWGALKTLHDYFKSFVDGGD